MPSQPIPDRLSWARPGGSRFHFNSVGVDGAIFDIWAALLNGAAFALLESDLQAIDEVTEPMAELRPTAILWYAGLHHMIIDHAPEAFGMLGLCIAGGMSRHSRMPGAFSNGGRACALQLLWAD